MKEVVWTDEEVELKTLDEKEEVCWAAQTDFRGLLGVRRMDKVPKARVRELCGVMNRVMKRIEGILRCISQ